MKWIRPFNFTILTLAVVIGFFMGKIGAEAFFGFATGIAIYWLKSRDEEKRNGTIK